MPPPPDAISGPYLTPPSSPVGRVEYGPRTFSAYLMSEIVTLQLNGEDIDKQNQRSVLGHWVSKEEFLQPWPSGISMDSHHQCATRIYRCSSPAKTIQVSVFFYKRCAIFCSYRCHHHDGIGALKYAQFCLEILISALGNAMKCLPFIK